MKKQSTLAVTCTFIIQLYVTITVCIIYMFYSSNLMFIHILYITTDNRLDLCENRQQILLKIVFIISAKALFSVLFLQMAHKKCTFNLLKKLNRRCIMKSQF